MTKPSIPLFDRNRDHPSVPQGAGDTAANFSSIKKKGAPCGVNQCAGLGCRILGVAETARSRISLALMGRESYHCPVIPIRCEAFRAKADHQRRGGLHQGRDAGCE